MVEVEKDGFVYPPFSPNENPFVEEKQKGKPTAPKVSNDIVEGDDSGDYSFLYWND